VRFFIGFLFCLALLAGALLWQISRGLNASRADAPAASPATGGSNLLPARFDDGEPPLAAAPQDPAPADASARPPNAAPAQHAAPPDPAITAPSQVTRDAPSGEIKWADATASGRADAERRLARAQTTLARDPDHSAALHDEYAALVALERWEQAALTINRLALLAPDVVDVRFEQAALAMRLKRWTEALLALRVVTEQRPDDARAWHNLAVAHQALGHLSDARQAWDRTLALAPASTEARARRGEVLLDQHEWAAAAEDLQAVLQAEPDAADAAANLALAQANLGRPDEARQTLRAVLERHPQHVPAMNRLAELAWRAYREDPAGQRTQRDATLLWCRRSLHIDPKQPLIEALAKAAEEAGSPNGP
jgi:tetratricopeptide (TPR) repeat protein